MLPRNFKGFQTIEVVPEEPKSGHIYAYARVEAESKLSILMP